MEYKPKPKTCTDCDNETTDVEYCEVCSQFVCVDCDDAHDCLAEDLEAYSKELDDANAEIEEALTEMLLGDEDDDAGNA